MAPEDWQVLDALQAACNYHADRMPAVAWIYPDFEHRRPIEITAPDPAWLARWRHDQVAAWIRAHAQRSVQVLRRRSGPSTWQPDRFHAPPTLYLSGPDEYVSSVILLVRCPTTFATVA